MKIMKLILGALCFFILLGCASTSIDKDSENMQEGTQKVGETEIEVENTTIDKETTLLEKERVVKDIEWDLAIEQSTKREKTYCLIDFDESIVVKYFKKVDKISSVEFGTVTGSLDDTLDITFWEDDGKEWHQYFSWAHPDKPGSTLIYRFNSEGEAYDYEMWSTTNESNVADYIKYYVIPEKVDTLVSEE